MYLRINNNNYLISYSIINEQTRQRIYYPIIGMNNIYFYYDHIKEIIPKISEVVEKNNANQVKSFMIIRKNLRKRRKETIKVSETLRKSSFLVKESVN